MINKKILLSILGALFGILTTNGQIECDYSVIVENEAVHRYMQEINYEPHDSSVIEKYKEGTTYRKDWPNPVVMNLPETNVDSVTIICYDAETLKDTLKFHVSTANTTVDLYNFIPRRKYQYEIFRSNWNNSIISSTSSNNVFTSNLYSNTSNNIFKTNNNNNTYNPFKVNNNNISWKSYSYC